MTPRIFLLGTVATLLGSCSSPTAEGQDGSKHPAANAQATPGAKSYGAPITADGAMAMADFAKAIQGKDSLSVKLECEIITTCQKKGCWMDVKMADGTPMKVRFKDYAFFVPTGGVEGKHAIIQGQAMKEVTDVGALKHYAEDAGKSPEEIAKITEPETSWSFTADGVIIRD